MQNFVQAGDTITVAAPYDVTSGAGAKVGQIFGVATAAADDGDDVALKLTGVFDLPKVGSQAWTVGALVYWDNTHKYCTTTATSNLLIGCAVAAVGNGSTETTGRVRLNGIARADEASS
jgi:predicted RecA/RadA family phage recombinase